MNGESGGMVNGGVEDFSVGEGAELTNLIPVMGVCLSEILSRAGCPQPAGA
jgi:hypothetical protein